MLKNSNGYNLDTHAVFHRVDLQMN